MKGYSEKYKCGRCGSIFPYRGDAEECCKPEVDHVYVCDSCNKEFDLEYDAKSHEHDGVPLWVERTPCLCGARLEQSDYEPSMVLGDQVRCERCREKILAGVPSGEAARQSFEERALAIR